jgi:hypothetical protein
VTQTLPTVQPSSTPAWAPGPAEPEYAEHAGRYTATATPTASSQSESSQANRQYRRDPAFRERVRELHAVNAPTSEIAAQLGTSSRTIRRILADLDAESGTSARQSRNPAQAAVSNWHNGFRVLPGGNRAGNGSGGGTDTADERTPQRADRSVEK